MNVQRVNGARTTLEVITVDGKTDDLGHMIVRGLIDAGDGNKIEFYIDNEKKYGCLYERKEVNIVELDRESFEEGDSSGKKKEG